MKNILGYRDYSSHREIRGVIKESVNYGGENVDLAEIFCFFETSKQKTWFISTNSRVYIVLDDIRKETLKVNRSYGLNSFYANDKLTVRIDPDYKAMYGRIFFPDETRGWLYSKKLYPSPQKLKEKIESVLKIVT